MPDVGHYRFLILGKDTVSFSAQPFHRFGKNLAKCQKLGIVPKAALIIGVDPIIAYACQVQVPDDTDDWAVAGGLRGAPVELTQCKTCDVEVPATSEVVIEFEVDLNNTVLEGPLGEYTGYYTRPSQKPVARITAITHRKKPIFQGLLTGKPVTENHILKQIPFEASFLRHTQAPVPDHQERVGARLRWRVVLCGNFHGAALRRRGAAGDPHRDVEQYPAEMDGDRRSRHRRAHSSTEVEWAMAFRVQPERDVIVIDNVPAGPSDPSVDDPRTAPCGFRRRSASTPRGRSAKPFYEVADVPGWEDYDVPELNGRR